MDDDRDRIRKAVSIVDLVSAVTTVKKSGRNHMAVCPFHQEKTPSMSLDVARGLYYCHGCHQKGDIFTFVQENEGLTFPEAMERLAGMAGITLTRDPAAEKRQGQKRGLVEATAAAVDFYHQTLMKSADAGHARAYLRSRGYDADTVAEFKLGYAPHGDRWDHLVRELRARGINDRVMIDAGLARKGQRGGLYDLFRDRVMFPTFDLQGSPIGFGGRVLGDGTPKYLNTPETPIYKKSETMYGIDKARREIQKRGTAIVVEGYTDVIALHRNGMPVAVATNGTALGESHFQLLRRFAERIVLSFDPDAAGARAALRGEESLGRTGASGVVTLEGLDIRVAELPDGSDPAEMVSSGQLDDLAARLDPDKCVPLREFIIRRRLSEVRLDNPELIGPAIESVKPLLSGLDPFAMDQYARLIASIVGGDHAVIARMLGSGPSARRTDDGPGTPRRSAVTGRQKTERALIRAALQDVSNVELLGEPERFTTELLRAAVAHIRRVAETVESGPIPLDMGDGDVSELLIELAMSAEPVGDIAQINAHLRMMELDAEIAEIRHRLSALDVSEQTSSPLFAQLLALQDERRKWEHRD